MSDDGIPRSTDLTTRRIAAALGRLPKRRREILLLHRLDGLSYVEIAGRLDISVEQVERHIAMVMMRIADELERPQRPWWRRRFGHWA